MIPEKTLRERYQAVVTATEAAILPYLKTVDPYIQQLHFEFGHPRTVTNLLVGMNSPQAQQFRKYPLLAVFEDITERGVTDGLRSHSPRIIIATSTEESYSREQRDTKNFKPLLIPIYNEFMRQLRRTGLFYFNYQKPGDKTDRPFWGLEGVYGNEGHILTDKVDCIEIRNLELTIPRTRCAPASKNF